MTSPQPLQRIAARDAQVSSHWPAVASQQSGSLAQTFAQQAASEQPGSLCGTKQLPLAALHTSLIAGFGLRAQVARAASTQVKSQLTEQQKLSM